MTIRKLWLLILISVALVSIGLNSLILSSLTDNYFKDYLTENYKTHLNQIIEYTENVLSDDQVSFKQMAMELEVHIIDPIVEIKLYSTEGDLLIDVNNRDYMMGNMPGMMSRFINNESYEETKQYEISNDNKRLGILSITSHSGTENSFVARRFKSSLFVNSVFAFLVVLILLIILGLVISKRMSRSLMDTAQMTSSIQQGMYLDTPATHIREVNAIRDGLKDLDVRLRLKQKSRKTLIDSLVHQTRTPLTILKSHIEAIEDGLIDADRSELSIWRDQVDNLTNIISNMSLMIDASKEVDELKIEMVNVASLIKQIKSGLKTQYAMKSIKLDLYVNDHVKIQTDKYKLSQSIFNLLVNAYKYTNEGGQVSVTTYIENDQLFIEVKDNGIGIGREELDNIFTAYYRGTNSQVDTGDGIGLYIVHENIQHMGGKIKVESQVGLGSCFTIELPLNESLLEI